MARDFKETKEKYLNFARVKTRPLENSSGEICCDSRVKAVSIVELPIQISICEGEVELYSRDRENVG